MAEVGVEAAGAAGHPARLLGGTGARGRWCGGACCASGAGARGRTQSEGVQMTVLVYVLVYISTGVVPACMFILF